MKKRQKKKNLKKAVKTMFTFMRLRNRKVDVKRLVSEYMSKDLQVTKPTKIENFNPKDPYKTIEGNIEDIRIIGFSSGDFYYFRD